MRAAGSCINLEARP